MDKTEASFFLVEKTDEGKRLDIFLQEKLGHYSRSWIQGSLNRVRVNGDSKKKQYRIRNLDRVDCEELSKFHPPSLEWSFDEELFQKLKLEIRYEDEYLLVLNKPRGIVVHPSRGHLSGTLTHALLPKLKGFSSIETINEITHEAMQNSSNIDWNTGPRPGIVHRLDKDTSGLMLWAKDPITQSQLCTAFQKREVKKEYLTLVEGEIPLKGEFSQAIGRDPKNRKKRSIRPDALNSKEAKTLYRRIDFYPSMDTNTPSFSISSPYKQNSHFSSFSSSYRKSKVSKQAYSLLRVHLITGRTHQIRVHLAGNGYPIFGDPLYSRFYSPSHSSSYSSFQDDQTKNTEKPLEKLGKIKKESVPTKEKQGMTLHSCFLSFVHPAKKVTMEFEVEVPLWFREILENLKKTRKI